MASRKRPKNATPTTIKCLEPPQTADAGSKTGPSHNKIVANSADPQIEPQISGLRKYLDNEKRTCPKVVDMLKPWHRLGVRFSHLGDKWIVKDVDEYGMSWGQHVLQGNELGEINGRPPKLLEEDLKKQLEERPAAVEFWEHRTFVMDQLDDNSLSHCLSYLRFHDICAAARVCTLFQRASKKALRRKTSLRFVFKRLESQECGYIHKICNLYKIESVFFLSHECKDLAPSVVRLVHSLPNLTSINCNVYIQSNMSLPNLKFLKVAGVGEQWLLKAPELKTFIMIKECRIEVLSKAHFPKLKNLELLDVTEGFLRAFESRKLFPTLRNLSIRVRSTRQRMDTIVKALVWDRSDVKIVVKYVCFSWQ